MASNPAAPPIALLLLLLLLLRRRRLLLQVLLLLPRVWRSFSYRNKGHQVGLGNFGGLVSRDCVLALDHEFP